MTVFDGVLIVAGGLLALVGLVAFAVFLQLTLEYLNDDT